MPKLSTAALLALALSTSIVQAQRAPAPELTQAQREEFCRNEAARGITSTTEDLPPGAVRATAVEFKMREQLCLKKAADADEAQLLSHRHYRAKDGADVHSPARSVGDQVPAGASAKCRDGAYSFSQHRRGTCSHHGGVSSWL